MASGLLVTAPTTLLDAAVDAVASSSSSDTAPPPAQQTPKRKPAPPSAAAPKKMRAVQTRSAKAGPVARRVKFTVAEDGDDMDESDDDDFAAVDSEDDDVSDDDGSVEEEAAVSSGDDAADADDDEPAQVVAAAVPAAPKRASAKRAPAKHGAITEKDMDVLLPRALKAAADAKTNVSVQLAEAVRAVANHADSVVVHVPANDSTADYFIQLTFDTDEAAKVVRLGSYQRAVVFEMLSDNSSFTQQVVSVPLGHPAFFAELTANMCAGDAGQWFTDSGVDPRQLFIGTCGLLLAAAPDCRLRRSLTDACVTASEAKAAVAMWQPRQLSRGGQHAAPRAPVPTKVD